MTNETARERRERIAREAAEAELRWESERPMRLLNALARANDLGIAGCGMSHRYDGVLYYQFQFNDWQIYADPFVELSEHAMRCIEDEITSIEQRRNRDLRLRKLRDEVIARLTDEEREALGL